ncbi:DUF402 domain-containing protein [Vulcanisaeta thermophila]|uniref:DUF402 domain-containing protein n=1 Tax=Vulcanisaeta thermophila TaxID=867917 RepID=UPI000852AD24|nr:DUF402 domain-containing protein [Vulcanisaeta thermophila]
MDGGTYKVRIRGRYATAITKLILDLGHTVVQPSDVIVSRFGIPINNSAPDVTIKDSEAIPGGLVLIGKCNAVDALVNGLMRAVGPEVFTWRSKTPLHRVYLGIISEVGEGTYKVHLGDSVGVLRHLQGGYAVGDVVPVYVAKTALFPGDEVVLAQGVRVDTDYVSIVPGDRVTISRHIRDQEARARLLSIGLKYVRFLNGFGIKWRSSAQFLSEEEAERELRRAVDLLGELIERSKTGTAPLVLQDGECVVELALGGSAKVALDNIRNNVIPTLIGHHTYKALKRRTALLDLVESLLSHCSDRKGFSEEFMRQLMSRRSRVGIIHVKLSGKVIKLGTADVIKLDPNEIVLQRRLRGGGYYDGLGIPKEEGDMALTCTSLGSNHLIHVYLNSRGEPKGLYININTPVEFTGNNIMYIDLSVDLASTWGSNDVRVLDYEEFMGFVNEGVVPREIVYEVNKLMETLRVNARAMAEGCLSRARELGGV